MSDLEGEVARARALADHFRLANQELRETADRLTHAHAVSEAATRHREERELALDLALDSAPFGIGLLDRLSSERGRGTTFNAYFPPGKRVDAGVPAAADVVSRPGLRPNVVLLIEDDVSVRQVVHRILMRNGCMVHDAENGRHAFETLARLHGAVDLVVTDVIMPEMGGMEFFKRVREQWPRARFLFMSGYTAESQQLDEFLHSGAVFIEKPFTSEALTAKVRELLEGRGTAGNAAA